MSSKQFEKLIEGLAILVVDQNAHMRRLTRMMLTNIGAKLVYEAAEGIDAIDVIRHANPDVMLLDWDCRCSAARRSCTSCARPACSHGRACR
jgi:CheY-like chemotaxis protein